MAKLIYVDNQGQEAVTHVNAQTPVVTIGRNPDRQIITADNTVSRRHAQVSLADGVFTFTDNKSSNGAYVNDVRIAEQVVKDGDILRCGSFILRFVLEDAERMGAVPQIDPGAAAPMNTESTAAFDFDIKNQQALMGELMKLKQAREQAEHQYRNQAALTQEFQRKALAAEAQVGAAQQHLAKLTDQIEELQKQMELKNQEIVQLRAASAGAGDADGATMMMDSGAAEMVEKFHAQISALREENEQLKAGAASAEELANIKKVVESLKNENQSLRVNLTMAEAQAQQQVDSSVLQLQLDELNEKNAALQAELDAQPPAGGDGEDTAALAAQIEQLQARNEQLQADLEQAPSPADGADSEELAAKIEALEAENRQLKEQLDEVPESTEGGISQEEYDALKKERDEANWFKGELETKVAELEQSAGDSGKLAELQEELKFAEDKIREMKDELRSRPAMQDIDDLNYERRELRDEVQRLTNALEMAPSVQDFDDLRFERDQLNEELAARPTAQQMQILEDDKLSALEEIENLKLTLAEAPTDDEMDRLRNELEEAQSQYNQMKAELEAAPSQQQVDHQQEEIDHLVNERRRFKEEKKILEERLVQLDEVKEQQLRDEFEGKMEEKEQQLKQLYEDFRKKEDELEEANKIILSANLDEVKGLRQFKEEALEEQQKLKQKISELERKSQSATDKSSHMEQQMFQQTAEVDELMRKNADLQREVEEYKEMMVYAPTSEQMEALKDDINQLTKERDQSQKQLDSIEDRHLLAFEQQEKQIGQLTEERDEALASVRGLKNQIADLQDTGGADPEVVSELKEQNRAQKNRIMDLEDQLGDLESQRAELDSMIKELKTDSADMRIEFGSVQSEWRRVKRILGDDATADDVQKLVNEKDKFQARIDKLINEKDMLEEMVVGSGGGKVDTDMADRLKDLKRENERLRSRVASGGGDGDADLKRDLEKLNDENEILKGTVRSYERKIVRLQESSGDDSKLQELKDRLRDVERERDRLSDKLANAGSGDEDMKLENRRLSREIEKLQAKVESASGNSGGGGALGDDEMEELQDLVAEVNDLASNWRMNIRLISEYFAEIKLGVMNLKSGGSSALSETLRDFESRETLENLEEYVGSAQEDSGQIKDSLKSIREILND